MGGQKGRGAGVFWRADVQEMMDQNILATRQNLTAPNKNKGKCSI
jgi:hypothetical protein